MLYVLFHNLLYFDLSVCTSPVHHKTQSRHSHPRSRRENAAKTISVFNISPDWKRELGACWRGDILLKAAWNPSWHRLVGSSSSPERTNETRHWVLATIIFRGILLWHFHHSIHPLLMMCRWMYTICSCWYHRLNINAFIDQWRRIMATFSWKHSHISNHLSSWEITFLISSFEPCRCRCLVTFGGDLSMNQTTNSH